MVRFSQPSPSNLVSEGFANALRIRRMPGFEMEQSRVPSVDNGINQDVVIGSSTDSKS